MDACFSDLGGLPEIDNFLLQLPLQLTAFRLRAWGGTSGGLFGSVFVDYANSTIFHHSVFYKIQRIPFNRLLTAFLKALFQQALVEQIQRIPFNRPLTVFLRALFQQASVEQMQRIPLNRLLMAIFLASFPGGVLWTLVFWILAGCPKSAISLYSFPYN